MGFYNPLPPPTHLCFASVELASSGKGGEVLESSDDFFGEASHLIKDGDAIEDKNRESANGFWKVRTDQLCRRCLLLIEGP